MNKIFNEIFQADYYRATGKKWKGMSPKFLFRTRNNPLIFIFYLRLYQSMDNKMIKLAIRCILRHYAIKFGFEISCDTNIGRGLRLPHYAGGVVIHPNTIIGKNAEIMQGVTIGNNMKKDRYAVAFIGDNVILSSGCKIIGQVKIGDNVIVGANAVVTHDVPSNSIVAGVPARIIEENTAPIVINSDY